MRERPILFSGPMVRAILDGRKTMTRRVVRFDKPFEHHDAWPYMGRSDDGGWIFCTAPIESLAPIQRAQPGKVCPYGTVGDRLWVRETWRSRDWAKNELQIIHYRADGTELYKSGFMEPTDGWHPSIHMPRWASRITLEITGVRVERLHDITPNECRAEGSYWATYPDDEGGFVNLWNGINGKRGYGWDVNPWVWVIGFERKVT